MAINVTANSSGEERLTVKEAHILTTVYIGVQSIEYPTFSKSWLSTPNVIDDSESIHNVH